MIKEQKLSLLFFLYAPVCDGDEPVYDIYEWMCCDIDLRYFLFIDLLAIYWWMALQLSHRSCEYSWSAIVEHIQWIIFTFTLNIFDFDLLRLNWKLNLRWWDIFFYEFNGEKNVQSNTGWTYFFTKKFIIQWNLIVSLRTGLTPFTKIIIYDFSNEKKVCGSITQAYFKFNLNNMKSQ